MKRILIYIKIVAIVALTFLQSCENNNSAIEEQVTKVTYPIGGDVFIREGILTIEWTDDVSSHVRIKLYKGNTRILNITESTENTGKYTWLIPDSLENGNDYRIKIFSNTDDFVFYQSNEFRILGKAGVSVYVDPRDNQSYKIVKIGNQWWFAENFKYKTSSGSWVYDNNESNSNDWGRLYDLQTAVSACPNGWQLPSDEDWKTLELFIGLKTTDINRDGPRGRYEGILLMENGGLDFNVKFGGFFSYYSFSFYNSWVEANFWSSTKYYSYSAWTRKFNYGSGTITRTRVNLENGLSVRYCKYEF